MLPQDRNAGRDFQALGLTEQAVNNALNEKQLTILGKYYEGKTLKEMGQSIGVTPERARQILHSTGRKLREIAGGNLRAVFDARTANALARCGILTLAQLKNADMSDLYRMRGIGAKSLKEIEMKIIELKEIK